LPRAAAAVLARPLSWQSAEPHCPEGLAERFAAARAHHDAPLMDERAATRGASQRKVVMSPGRIPHNFAEHGDLVGP